ncbi:MAG: VWA domain-containing protein [Colwellia sp.]
MSAQQTNVSTQFSESTSNTLFEAIDFQNINFDGFSLVEMSNHFHFIRPWWLVAFIALFMVIFIIKKIRYYQSPWQHFLPAHLASALLENSHSKATPINTPQGLYWLKPFIVGCCVILALAGPAWQKLPQPVYQLERGAVIIMDMSYSMYATDVKPNRLTRARYKAIDLLKKIKEGDVGLIAYAGDAFIISPLTQDDNNIALLLPSLSPDIMPAYGANALAALTLADSTLKNAGHISGDIYWFTDDLDNEEMSDVFDWANSNNHTVNILGVGSKDGAPIKLSNGKLLKDNNGAIVIPKLPIAKLLEFARSTGGVYHTMTNGNADINALTAHLTVNFEDAINSQTDESTTEQAMQGDQYQEQGPWLLLIILPLLLSYFRRGTSILVITWLMPLTLMLSLVSISPNSYAATTNTVQSPTPSETQADSNSANQWWRDLWQTSDQQAQQHYQQKDYAQAAKQFEESQWQGSAHYKAGDYEKALQAFKQSDTAQSLYNQGNSLAQLQKIDEAIDAYQQALAKDPNLTHAKENLEMLKKQQEQEQEQEQQEQGDKQGSQENKDGESQPQDQSQAGDEQENPQNQEESQEEGQGQEQNQDQDQADEQQDEAEKAAQEAKESDEEPESDEKSSAQLAQESKTKETEQRHQQLLNKVTDDPYLLLRNKMRLEYQKRQNDGAPQGVTKKW